ncbi:MAG: DinB family protein [Ignavibacteriaceae bacterium]
MFRKIEDFKKAWTYETEATLKMLAALTDESLKTKVYPEGRDLGFIAWHITVSLSEMANKTGLSVPGPDENSDRPESAKAIHDEFKASAEGLLKEVSEKWKDEDLLTKVNMYGEEWENGNTLYILITHQAHHRGQMTVLMRQAGLTFPGVYGPSKEEWVNYGAPPAK